jgi:hypothetical protein
MDERPTPDRTRREGVEVLSITLDDGNAWGLAKPSLRLSPRIIEGVDSLGRPHATIRVATKFGYPLEIRRLIDDLRSACEQETAERQYETLIRLAAALILRAHEINLSDALCLLELGVDDLPRLVQAVLSVVTGDSLQVVASTRVSNVDG